MGSFIFWLVILSWNGTGWGIPPGYAPRQQATAQECFTRMKTVLKTIDGKKRVIVSCGIEPPLKRKQ